MCDFTLWGVDLVWQQVPTQHWIWHSYWNCRHRALVARRLAVLQNGCVGALPDCSTLLTVRSRDAVIEGTATPLLATLTVATLSYKARSTLLVHFQSVKIGFQPELQKLHVGHLCRRALDLP